jgi:hypothetical protein
MSWRAARAVWGGWRVVWGDEGAYSCSPNKFGRVTGFGRWHGRLSPDLTTDDIRAALDTARQAVPPARNGQYGHKSSEHRRRLCEALAEALNAQSWPLTDPGLARNDPS